MYYVPGTSKRLCAQLSDSAELSTPDYGVYEFLLYPRDETPIGFFIIFKKIFVPLGEILLSVCIPARPRASTVVRTVPSRYINITVAVRTYFIIYTSSWAPARLIKKYMPSS